MSNKIKIPMKQSIAEALKNPTTNVFKVIESKLSPGQQSLHLKELLEFNSPSNSLKLLIEITSDSYEFQSSATIKVFRKSELAWGELYSIHYGQMQTPAKLISDYRAGQNVWSSFAKDRESLLNSALSLLE